MFSTQWKKEKGQVSLQNVSKPSRSNLVKFDVNEKFPVSRDHKFYPSTPTPLYFLFL
jgi:hypothetical protein